MTSKDFNSSDKYVISLPNRSDRRSSFIVSAAKAGIKDYRFFRAVPGITKEQKIKGCLLSHKSVIYLANQAKLPHVVIMEDDCNFSKDFLSGITGVPPDWDMLYFGAHNHVQPTPVNQNIGRCNYTLSTICYAVRSTCYDLITDHLSQDQPIDMIYANQVHKLINAYCIVPNLVSQITSYSDIEERVVDYSCYY